MIYYLTVHWKIPDWIPVQRRYFEAFSGGPFKVFAFLNGFPADQWVSSFDFVSTEPIVEHAIKLNLLADLASMDSRDANDVLVFIDGDAFPIADLSPLIAELSPQLPLIAAQRMENAGDRQPHPSFCVTTVGFWRQIGGDWKSGATWLNDRGESVTDVGGNFLAALEAGGIDWKPLLRSNTRDLHPLWYGIYGDVAYHHGAAFRPPVSRLDFPVLQRLARALPKPLRAKTRDWFLGSRFVNRGPALDNGPKPPVLEDIQNDFNFFSILQKKAEETP